MTPEEERALLAATAARLDEDLREAYNELVALIREGVPVRQAVAQVMGEVSADMASAIAIGLSAVLAQEVTPSDVLRMGVGTLQISARLNQEAQEVGAVVGGILDAQERAFSDLEAYALAVYLAYALRNRNGTEAPRIDTRNTDIPQTVRRTLLGTSRVQAAIAAAFAVLDKVGLSEAAQTAAYQSIIKSIAVIKVGVAFDALAVKLRTAFLERLSYVMRRLALTELHTAFTKRLAALILQDDDVQYVQVARGSRNAPPCMCDAFTGRDQYGLGAGVYPKNVAPLPPYHPNCYCWWKRRPDVHGPAQLDTNADAYFLRKLGQPLAARIAGSRAKLEQLLGGARLEDVANAGRLPQYKIGPASAT